MATPSGFHRVILWRLRRIHQVYHGLNLARHIKRKRSAIAVDCEVRLIYQYYEKHRFQRE